MPLYEYFCQACATRFEAYVRGWSERVACPGCEGGVVEKLVSSFAVASGAGAGAGSRGGGCGCARAGCGCQR